MFLNASLPQFQALLRAEYLYDGDEAYKGSFVPVVVFGVGSVCGRAVGFHVQTERGAVIWRLPVSAIVRKPDAPDLPLDHLELWDCFSYEVAVTQFDWLSEQRCRVLMKDRSWEWGTYRLTLDWCGSAGSEDAGDIGHKCAHLIDLDNGCFALQPNNRIFWHEPSFVTKPFAPGDRPDYKVNSRTWKVETLGRWATEHSDLFFYDTRPLPDAAGEGKGERGESPPEDAPGDAPGHEVTAGVGAGAARTPRHRPAAASPMPPDGGVTPRNTRRKTLGLR